MCKTQNILVVPWLVAYERSDMTFRAVCYPCDYWGLSTPDNERAAIELENHLTSDMHRGLD